MPGMPAITSISARPLQACVQMHKGPVEVGIALAEHDDIDAAG
jgi:hypothetical protein